jgi:Mg2+/Co2+ transporter CorB
MKIPAVALAGLHKFVTQRRMKTTDDARRFRRTQNDGNAQAQRFQNFLQGGQPLIAMLGNNFVEARSLESHTPDQITHRWWLPPHP